MKKDQAFQVGTALGIIFLIVGFRNDNSSTMILAVIMLAIGLWSKFGKKKDD